MARDILQIKRDFLIWAYVIQKGHLLCLAYGLALFICLIGSNAQAETIASTALLGQTVPATPTYINFKNPWATHNHLDATEACESHAALDQNRTDACGITTAVHIGEAPNAINCQHYSRGDCFHGNGPFDGAITYTTVYTCSSGELSGANCIGATTYSCSSTGGWTLSADQQTCSRPDCPNGRDPNTGACLDACPSGYVRNMSTMQCDIVCDAPLIRTPANTCDCPSPTTLIYGNTCVGSDDKDRGKDCSQQITDPPKWYEGGD